MANLEDILHARQTGRWFVMGVLNVTPDSFSDGGQYVGAAAAVARAEAMLAEGADLLDLGAESSRPGSQRVPPDEQIRRLERILPAVCEAAAMAGALVSIDTTRSAVARFALDCGAAIVNDISACREDGGLADLVAERRAGLVLMHMLGEPATMQQSPRYDDVVAEVRTFLAGRLETLAAAGVPPERCLVDPGIGFGKRLEDNLDLLAGLGQLADLGAGLLLGPSRKGFIGTLGAGADGQPPPPEDRLGGTIAACLAGRARGATVFRVHDVAAVRQALRVAEAIDKRPSAQR